MPTKAKEKSKNKKIGEASTTYAGLNTCPNSCPFKKTEACYGQCGPIGIIFRNVTDMKRSAVREAKSEASKIRKLTGLKDLRLHSTGDSRTNETTKILADACKEYSARFGKTAWTYTHAWREVNRSSWGDVSVLASLESTNEIKKAWNRNYPAAIVFQKFSSTKPFTQDGYKIIPCPNQVAKSEGKKVTCTDCRLCLKADKLLKHKLTIAFAIHGPTKKAARMLSEKNQNGKC